LVEKKVLIEKAGPDDKIGDVYVDIEKTFKVYQAWRDVLTRPAPGPNGLRRPKWFKRPTKLTECLQLNSTESK